MPFTIEFNKPEIKGSFDWQLIQQVNVLNEDKVLIAKAEIELITLNKHRDALKSYTLIEGEDESTDWELPLNLYFKGQNLSQNVCHSLNITADVKKAKTHIMIEAISVLPSYRSQGVAKYLLQELAKNYSKVQSITVLTMPLKLFVDAEECEEKANKDYYQQLELQTDKTDRAQLREFFTHNKFIEYKVDEALLNEPLSFDLFITTPSKLTGE